MLYDFQLAGKRVRLWRRTGESYEHVLMKALGCAMFIEEFPALEIERRVGLRYKPDLVAQTDAGDFIFWGEAGENSFRKTLWLLKHARVERLVLFKIAVAQTQLVKQLRAEIPPKYRAGGRLVLINFSPDIKNLTIDRKIERVPENWFGKTEI